ncbi:MAG: ABC transporter ATP-binding protein [Bacteroidia bacterium]
MSNKVIETIGVSKEFSDPIIVKVLNDVSFHVDHGEFVSIMGKSGCGKSTLLYILSTMDTDYQGKLFLNDELLSGKNDTQLAKVRNEKIGFVFQFHYLLQEFSVVKNVMIPGLKLGKYSTQEIEYRAMERLKMLGMQDHALKKPNQLSGGQKQRVAIARALINDPLIIMGDEPTGNLDKLNSDLVFDIFSELTKEKKQTILVVTHDPEFADKTDRIIIMADGKIV